MFYLVQWFKVLKENFTVAIIFLVSSALLVTFSHNYQQIKAKLSLQDSGLELPYFNALVTSKENMASVIRRMKMLPGVASVELVSSDGIKQEINRLKKTFGESAVKGFSNFNPQKLRVELDQGLRDKSRNLIREYLVRLVGEQSITMSNVKTPQSHQTKLDLPANQLIGKIEYLVFGIFGGLWIISSLLLIKSVRQLSYLIEKFQRKRHTTLKIYLSGLVGTIGIFYSLNFIYQQKINVLSFVTPLGMVLLAIFLTYAMRQKTFMRQ